MSENIQSISQGTFTIGQTSATNFQAGPGISITQPSEGVVRIANDETVLWSGNEDTISGKVIQLSEKLSNFDRIKIEMMDNAGWNSVFEEFNSTAIGIDNKWRRNIEYVFHTIPESYTNTQYSRGMSLRAANGSATTISAYGYEVQSNGGNANASHIMIKQVIGINRISGSNA